jgi:aminopeptidase N
MSNYARLSYLMLSFLLVQSCKPKDSENTLVFNDELHSFANTKQVHTTHLNWDAAIDFDRKQVSGTATWNFVNDSNAHYIHFDTYDLTIKKVKVNNKESQYFLSPMLEEYGSGLSIPIQQGDTVVSIEYFTGPQATALQWLKPEQTAGKQLPYMFTQCESIHARSLLPCQDLPSNRITYEAKLQVPKGMLAVMSAKNPIEKNKEGIYTYQMEIPVPTYLIALAVGDIEYKAIDERSGVYTEPSMLDAAWKELSDIPMMMTAAEKLGGPYRWGKYDVLIAPPSFPIGGMENPRLTFATPTIIAGDKSLVSLIAHEMAHSWSGNLVTNARWDDLWLNEGFTTYFERRIMESISGKSYTEMLWELGYQDMQSDFKDMGQNGEDTRLKVNLKKRNPGDAFSNIPYEKGAIFLRMLEEQTGREKFDAFMNAYFSEHAFKPTTTEQCLAFMDRNLFNGDSNRRNALKVRQWIYETGLPDNCPKINPERFVLVDQQRALLESGAPVSALNTLGWTTHEWLQFLRKMPRPTKIEWMTDLDQRFQLTKSTNSEIADEWFKLSIASNYQEAFDEMEIFLSQVGRKKFLEPLYLEMKKTPENLKMAQRIFAKYRNNYHPQTASKIEKILNAK